jgi:NAD(P)H-hydrate epimerase
LAQQGTNKSLHPKIVATAAWWHAQGGIMAAKEHTVMGVDGLTLIKYLTDIPILKGIQA